MAAPVDDRSHTVWPHIAWVVFPGDDVEAALLGGKAAALCTLVAHGVPVPPFAVVTTEAYRHGRDPLDDELAASIGAAGAIVAGTAGQLAVRSSATVEDRPDASFAGQFHSVLNVNVPDGVLPAVQAVWASLSSQAAVQYRARHRGHRDEPFGDEPAMAVVLMRQVAARRSGVAFTCDPTAGADWMRVEAVDGTADRLVSGAVTPDVVRVARHGAAVTDPVTAEVVRWAARCEEIFGEPQDVEWVWDGARVMVVQSRPITARAAPTEPAEASWALTTAGIGEMLPGVLSPSVASTAVTAVDHAITALLHRLGALPGALPPAGGVVVCVDHRAALRWDLLVDAARRLPSTTPERLRQQLVGQPATAQTDAPAASWRRRLAHDLRVVRIRRRTADDAEVVLEAVERLMEDTPSRTAMPSTSEERWALRQRMNDLLLRTVETEVATAALATAAFDRLVGFLSSSVGADAPTLATELTRTGVRSPLMMRWMALAEVWRSHPLGRQLLGEPSWETVVNRLRQAADEGQTLLDGFQRTVRRAGSRAVPGGDTWDDDPQAAWTAIRAASTLARHPGSEGVGDASDVIDRLRATASWRRRRLLTGWVIDSQAISMRRHVRESVGLLSERERLKDAVLCVGGEVRRLHRDVGDALVSEGRLAPDTDVRHLSVGALARLVRGDDEVPAAEVFEGWAASSGVYEGWARVVTSADDPFESGEILVARTTDPSWSPLFMTAGALVVEQGGLLSHAAVIARELGLPAVVNVPGVTARVETGMRLRVDGGTGRVTIVEEERHAPDRP